MRIILLGNTGQLGWELERSLAPLGDVIALDYPAINLANAENTRQVIRQLKPGLLINATAYTAVDRAEAEPELASAVNASGPACLSEEALRSGAAFIHFSTDYVFDGLKGSAYLEMDTPNPLGVYGRSKLAGEQAIQKTGGAYLILRTSWVYSLRHDSFVSKVLGWARQQPHLKLVTDQVSGPTWARMLAEITAQLIALGGMNPVAWLFERRGLYHLAGSGYCSRLEWGREILRLDPHKDEQVVHEVLPALTADFPTAARRPLFSALNNDHFTQVFGLRLPDWQSALRLSMQAP